MADRKNTITLQALALAIALVSSVNAQTPIPEGPMECGGVQKAQQEGIHLAPAPLEPRKFSVDQSGLCSQYSTAGWEQPMRLYLGEGAFEYLYLVEMAVDLWNTSLAGFKREPVIEIVRTRAPRNFQLAQRFWTNSSREADRLLGDGQSVIYFKSGASGGTSGFASWTWDRNNRLQEADIYINTTHQDQYGPNLVKTQMLMNWNDSEGIYAMVNAIYLTIIHEIGHALGLQHLAVSGNIMSYNYMPRTVNTWQASLATFAVTFIGLGYPDAVKHMSWFFDHDDVSPYMLSATDDETLSTVAMFTKAVELGEQDKMALMCIYDFEDWNH